MGTLPQLIDEDAELIRSALKDFLARSEAEAVLITAEGGFVIFNESQNPELDCSTLGALAANSFQANQAIAGLIGENNFRTLYQQGETQSLLICDLDHYHALVVVFPARQGVGAVKFYAETLAGVVASQLEKARRRTPEKNLDAAMLNLEHTDELFQKKKSAE